MIYFSSTYQVDKPIKHDDFALVHGRAIDANLCCSPNNTVNISEYEFN